MTDNSQTFENHTSPDLRGGRCLQVAESAGAIAGATGRPRAGASRDGATSASWRAGHAAPGERGWCQLRVS